MRTPLLKWMNLLGVALLLAFMAPQRAAADEDDPPSRVARLGYINGAVSFEPAGTDDWVSAIVNRPMTTGDKLWSDNGSRAEMHIGSASLSISSNTGFSFLNLTDDITQLRITEGTLRVRVKRLDDNETFEVDTPNLAFSILRPGIYKINVNEAGDTTLVEVSRGEGEVTGGGSAYTIHAGEAGTFAGTDQLSADLQELYDQNDDFDRWCRQRDHREDVSVSARYVSTDAIGYEDLDEYGGWRPVPEYGTIWFPHTSVVGWAPYHYGHWAYIAPWGYTWVDDEPWGFAPFHYGRWVNVEGAWGWVPCAPRPVEVVGVAYVRPVYAPALVAWVGGAHFAIGISVGGGGGYAQGESVGWFPLGPREVYVPSYPVSRTYVNNVNITNTTVNTTVVNNYYNTTVINKTTNVNNSNVTVNNQHYANQSVPGAVAATTPQAFTSAQPVHKNVVAVNQREMASAPVVATTPAVAPAKQAVVGVGAPAVAKPPAAVQTRAVVAKVAPPPPPVPFVKQQQAIQANGGKPLAVSQVRQIHPAAAAAQAAHPIVKIAPPATPATPQNVQANKPGQPANNGNRPAAVNALPQPANNANRPGAPTSAVPPPNNSNRPATSNNPSPPVDNGNKPGNTPGSAPVNGSPRSLNDRPPSARPANPGNNANSAPTVNPVNPPLEQKHQQQVEQLHQQQDHERQKVEQQQQQERLRLAQQKADLERQQQQKQQQEQQKLQQQQQLKQQQQQLEQKHNQELQQLQEKHQQEQQMLQQKQQQEHAQERQKAAPPPPPAKPKQDKPPNDEKPPSKP